MPANGGAVPTDANLVVAWVEEVPTNPAYQDTTKKLLALDAEERHVFHMSGSPPSFGADERLRRLCDVVPTWSPRLPAGITHVWDVPRSGRAAAVLWAADRGWSAVSLHDYEEPAG